MTQAQCTSLFYNPSLSWKSVVSLNYASLLHLAANGLDETISCTLSACCDNTLWYNR